MKKKKKTISRFLHHAEEEEHKEYRNSLSLEKLKMCSQFLVSMDTMLSSFLFSTKPAIGVVRGGAVAC